MRTVLGSFLTTLKGSGMTLTEIARRAERFAIDNSPAIMTAIGVTGTLTTVYLTGSASFKAAEILQRAENEHLEIQKLELVKPENFEPLPGRDKFELVWRLYVPAAGMGILTVTSIVLANRIGNRRAAALATAYSISERAFTEYREKVSEKIGVNKEQVIRDSISQDRIDRNPVSTKEVIITGGGDVLCYDVYTGRYFKNNLERLKQAQNNINYKVLNSFYASLSDFYEEIGLPPTGSSEEVGWNSDKLLDLDFSAVLAENGEPCITVTFNVAPIRGYYRVS